LRDEAELANIPRKSRFAAAQLDRFSEDRPPWADHRYNGPDTGGGPSYYGGYEDFPRERGNYHQQGGDFMRNRSEFGGDFGRYHGSGGGHNMDSYGQRHAGGNSLNRGENFGWNPTAVKDYSAPTVGASLSVR
jgi:hypothetical protein